MTENLNDIFRRLRDEDRWVWIMGDDHAWTRHRSSDMLETLDEHPEIDVLVPLCTKRNPPWHLVLFDELGYQDDGRDPDVPSRSRGSDVPASGVFEVDAAGSAGMLIRREVIDGSATRGSTRRWTAKAARSS